METNKPICAKCDYMEYHGVAKITANTHRYPRKQCWCGHEKMRDAFSSYYRNRYSPATGFICFTSGRDGTMTTKTAPRWCPLRNVK